MKYSWKVNAISGSGELVPGENRVIVPLKDMVLEKAVIKMNVEPAQKMFFNGFQTWTYCPEYSEEDGIRGLNGLPKFLVRKFSLDRYSDYHFTHYSNRKGYLHGKSYCYFRDGGHYRLFASLDEEPGYTCFAYDCETARMRIFRDCAGVKLVGEHSFHAFDLFYAEGTAEEVFSAWFDALGIHNSVPKLTGYSSWYNHYQDINEAGIRDDLAGAERVFLAGDLFQIDDGWEPFVGDWEGTDPVKFPNGLKPIADDIHARGLKAGLWLAPFICETKSALYREHPDWLLKVDGKPWQAGCNWSGYYSLDIDNPEVIRYLDRVFDRVFNEWGFDLVKLDFLYAAAPFGTGEAGSYSESRAARMLRAMRYLRKVCEGRLILGCGVPVMPAFGLVDYCRIGCDVGLDWNDKLLMRIIHRERVSTKHSVENTIFRRELDGRAHGNDPDVFFLRDGNIRLSKAEKRYLATADALFGSLFLTSDNLNSYDEKKIAEYRELLRLREATEVSVDPDTLELSWILDGKKHTLKHPHRKSIRI